MCLAGHIRTFLEIFGNLYMFSNQGFEGTFFLYSHIAFSKISLISFSFLFEKHWLKLSKLLFIEEQITGVMQVKEKDPNEG
jgi:hypothetical protein